MKIVRGEDEINKLLNDAQESVETGDPKFPGMSFEQGLIDMHAPFFARLTTYSAVIWIVSQLRAAGRVATVTHRGDAWKVTA